MSSIDHYKNSIRNLLAENARLKRQLDLMIKAQDGRGGCPDNVNLSVLDCGRYGCSDCWKRALEEVE